MLLGPPLLVERVGQQEEKGAGMTARGTLLVVEDDPAIAEVTRLCLQEEGYRVAVATTFAQAVEALTHTRFALVLADTLGATAAQPDTERWALLEQLRVLAGYTPVVLFTAHRAQDFAGFAARGFRDLLLKPFDLDELVATVQRSMGPTEAPPPAGVAPLRGLDESPDL